MLRAVFGTVFLLFPAAIGTAVRYRASYRLREIDQVKLLEREQSAGELHETVADHVSAIAIRAQAGRPSLAVPRPTVRSLEVIEEERRARSPSFGRWSVSCATTRSPRSHRYGGRRHRGWPAGPHKVRVDVVLSGDLDASGRRSALDGSLAQESITNASQHARNATRIHVFVAGDEDCVRRPSTTVTPSQPNAARPATVVGMTERASSSAAPGGGRPREGGTVRAACEDGVGR